MLLKDAKIGRTYTVKSIHLPFQLERRLEALGMTRQTAISVLTRTAWFTITRFLLSINMIIIQSMPWSIPMRLRTRSTRSCWS